MTVRPSTSWLRLLLLFSVAGFIEAALYGHVAAFTPLYLPRLGVTQDAVARWTGLSVAVSTLVGIPFLPLWGALADRYARKPIIVRSFVAHILACTTMALAGGLWVFIAVRAIMSFALGNTGLMMTTLSERAPRERIGLAFSIVNGAGPVGAFMGPLLGGPIVDRWGFPTLLVIDTALMLAVVAALTLGYRDSFTPSERGRVLTMAADSVRTIWRSSRLRLLFPALFVLFSGWMLAFTYVPLVTAALYRGDDPGAAVGLVMGAGGLAALVLSPTIGAPADRFGHWRTLFAAAAAEVVLWPLPAYAGTFEVFTLAWAVLNGVAGAVFAISFSVLSSSTPDSVRGRVMSFSYLPITVGLLMGPALGSVITTRSVFAVFPAAAVVTALGVGAMALAARQNGSTR